MARPIFLWFLVASLVFAGPALAHTPGELARMKAGESLMTDVPVAEGGAVKVRFFVEAPLAVARGVLWDHERFPEWMPNTKWVKVLEREGNTHIVEMGGGKGPVTVSYVTERRLEPRRIVWHTLKGDVKRNDGAWTIDPVAGGVVLTYDVHVVPHGAVPGFVVSYLQQQGLSGMIAAVRARIQRQAREG